MKSRENKSGKRMAAMVLSAVLAVSSFSIPAYAAGKSKKGPDIYNEEMKRTVATDPQKGQVDSETGIITEDKDGYSRWIQDETGWKLLYADGTEAAGNLVTDESGTARENYVWEQVDGAWYAFGSDHYAVNGWLYDQTYSGWFYIDVNTGMKTGWQLIDGSWYYFNLMSAATMGKMSTNTRTPDGYFVDWKGVWDGKEPL